MSTDAYLNISLQTFGGLFSLMIVIFLKFIRPKYTSLDRLYARFLLCNTLVLFANSLTWVFDGWPGAAGRWAVTIANFCMFAFSYALFIVFAEYFSGYMKEKGADAHKSYLR